MRGERRGTSEAVWYRRRRLVGLLVALAAVGLGVGGARALQPASPAGDPPATPSGVAVPAPGVVRVLVEGRAPVSYALSRFTRDGKLDRRKLARDFTRDLPAAATMTRGRATVVLSFDTERALRRLRTVTLAGAKIRLRSQPLAGRVPAPVIAQKLRNNCESAALSILLATQGKTLGQLELQRAFPRSGTPDPVDTAEGRTWGDPDRGYVGRPEGGVAGGFGVYPKPVAVVAARVGGERLEDLTSKPASVLYRRLRAGKAVMTWIGLSEGPYGTWTTPNGGTAKVNFGEHTVVIHGITGDGELIVSNPLLGTRERWSQSEFEVLYERLGRRSLATT